MRIQPPPELAPSNQPSAEEHAAPPPPNAQERSPAPLPADRSREVETRHEQPNPRHDVEGSRWRDQAKLNPKRWLKAQSKLPHVVGRWQTHGHSAMRGR